MTGSKPAAPRNDLPGSAELRALTSDEAAARLGIKVETLYAYVSRGRVTRHRTAQGSRFDALEIEELAAQRGPKASVRRGSVVAKPLMVLDTDLAVIEDDELYFRGERAADLAMERTIEDVAAWVWTGQWGARLAAPVSGDLTRAKRLVDVLPSEASRIDQLRAIALGLGVTDPWQTSASADALRLAGARFLLGVPTLLEPADANPTHGARGSSRAGASHGSAGSVAETLWASLVPAALQPASPSQLRVINAALILTIDHDLAISTLAGRLAATGRASGYSVISAALGAFASRLHGGASIYAARLLRAVLAGTSVERALSEMIAFAGQVPGFGQPLYTTGDARAKLLLGLISGLPDGAEVAGAVGDLVAVVGRRSELKPNVDLALAAIAVASGMRDDDGTLLFGLGRSVGWIAHALSELDEKPLRLRPQGRYVGP